MNNAEFSKLLASGDKAVLNSLTHRTKRRGDRGDNAEGDDGDAKKQRKRLKPQKKEVKEEEKKDTGPVWRDRAKERQAGEGEYKQIAEEFEQHAEVSVEESKFLGGDMDHTHLVKGLDYALLGKNKKELELYDKVQKTREAEAARRRDRKKTKEFASVMGQKIHKTVLEVLHPHHHQFKQRLANMATCISQGQRIRGAPLIFQPGFMSYEFDIDVEMGPDDIPKFITRSKEECPKPNFSNKPGYIHPSVLSNIETVLSDIKGRRRMRKEMEEAKKREELEKEKGRPEDDIFLGVGGFKASDKIQPKKTSNAPKSYFDDDISLIPSKKTTKAKEDSRREEEASKSSAPAASASQIRRLIAKAAEEDDAYGELFPQSNMFKHNLKEIEKEEAKEKAREAKGKGKGKGKKLRDEKEEKEDKYATEGSKAYGSKHKIEKERKKGKLNEDQQWDKIEQMISKGSVQTIEAMESHAAKKKKR